jgi:mannose-6-phosphate isomerase-like protein (cupin superfamily)
LKYRNDYKIGASSNRPWGRWAVLATGDGFAVKEISVNPGHILSLQSHQHRAEHWVILNGQAEVTLDGKTFSRGADEAVFIPAMTKHRIANSGETMLTFIEVQTGLILSEEDIERFDDRYGR